MTAPTAPRTGALDADVLVHRDDFTLQAAVQVPPGGRLAVLGPNGSGKSTLLSALAGLVALDGGRISLDERELERAGGLRLRPEQRGVALLDQKPRLFPHLSVAQNIAFAPRARGVARGEARRIAIDWLDRLGLAGRGDERPHRLSGGQQQRVAIARALAAEPALVLLDEPFAALDAESAPAVRRMLSDQLSARGVSSILVTHDLADAWQLADDCMVLDHGRVLERAAPAELVASPRHPFTARLAGFDVVSGVWSGVALELGDGSALPGGPEGQLAAGDHAFAVLAPSAAEVRPDGAYRMRVDAVSAHAGVMRVEHRSGLTAVVPDEEIRSRSALPRVGEVVTVLVPPLAVRRAPDASGR